MIDARRIDELADQFETAWKTGKRISADAVDASSKTMILILQKADGTSKTVPVEMGW